MHLIRSIGTLKKHHVPSGCVVTIGNYDGLHNGHMQILAFVLEKAKELNVPSCVITFDPLPREYFHKKLAPLRLMGTNEKLHHFKSIGINLVICLKFNEYLSKLSAKDFLQDFLVNCLNVKCIVLGQDFAFGNNREGDVAFLREQGVKFGFEVEVVPTFSIFNMKVGATMIRSALEDGDVVMAGQLLGRPYSISGTVAYGARRGASLIGFPTANIYIKRNLLPIFGVYVVRVYGLGPKPCDGVANIGFRPTFNGEKALLEVHLFDFSGNIYGHKIVVEFLHKLRNEQRFDNFVLLSFQIERDIAVAREFLSRYEWKT